MVITISSRKLVKKKPNIWNTNGKKKWTQKNFTLIVDTCVKTVKKQSTEKVSRPKNGFNDINHSRE